MIANFFQCLEAHGVEWLLISGQATILYGAATFSEDVDLWVNPSVENLERLRAALHASSARYYKLTPRLAQEFALRHHGFHFVVPGVNAGADLYLDVMGCPPRVGAFEVALQAARRFETPWGILPTVGIRDLVEIKKTQRPRDYPIIGRLVLALIEERAPAWTMDELTWATDHVFGLPELAQLFHECPPVRAILEVKGPPLRDAAQQLAAGGPLDEQTEDAVEAWFDARVAELRKADRRFWRGVIDELRQLRASGELMAEGAAV